MPIYIQPGGVNGRVMNFQALCDLSGDGRVKGFIERSNGVNIQIIHDQHNLYHSGCNGPPPTHAGNGQNPRRSWCRSALLLSCWPAVQTRRTGLPHRSGGIHNPLALDLQVSAESNKLPVRLIQADHRAQRIIRTLIYIQNVLHPRYKLRPWFWDAPLLFLPRLKFVFFSVSMTAVSEMLSTTPSRTSSSAISCSVHRSRPSGASEQEMAMM